LGLGTTNAFATPAAPLPGSEVAFGSFGNTSVTPGATNAFSKGVVEGAQAYNAAPSVNAIQDIATVDKLSGITTLPSGQTTAVAPQNVGAFTGQTPPQGLNLNYLASKDALGDAIPIATSAAAMTPGADDTTFDTTTDDKMNYRGEVYYTPYGERRTRAVPLAMGGSVYGDYDGVEEGYARGGGIGFIESIQPGGAFGNMSADAYGMMHKNMPGFVHDITPGGFIGATTPGKNQYLRQKQEEEDRKRAEQEGIAAAAAAKESAAFNDKWSQRYGTPMRMAEGGEAFYTSPNTVGKYRGEAFTDAGGAVRTRAVDITPKEPVGPGLWRNLGLLDIIQMRKKAAEDKGYEGFGMAAGGVSDLGHYSDGGRMLKGPGDGVSDSIPASIEGKRPARLADGEFVVPARIVSELGNGSTDAGAKRLYSMLERVQRARNKTVGKGKVAVDSKAHKELDKL
jgi:hypothetical protein